MKRKIRVTSQRNMYSFHIIFLLILSCNSNSRGQVDNTLSSDFSTRIDSLITTTYPRHFNGVILITQGGKTKYLREQGYSDFEKKTPISVNDQFRIMSNSKQVTAVLILKEVEKGNIVLENPISNYLTDLEQAWADTVTVEQLLNMSSGIVDIDKELLFPPGEGYFYSNPGYGLLGRIIKTVTGKDYKENANELFKSLGMNNSYCYEINNTRPGLINGYSLLNGVAKAVDFSTFGFYIDIWNDFLPAGGIVSNAYDLNKWDNKLHKGEILEKASYAKMLTPINRGPHAAFDNDTIGYGYGLRIHDEHPVYHFGHGGRGFGFVSIKFYVPEKDIDVIIWENMYYRDDVPDAASIIYHFENEIRKIVLNSNFMK